MEDRGDPHHRDGFNRGLLTAALVCLGNLATAQTASEHSEPASDGGDVLPTITVTAQRRTESPLDIPFDITVISADSLRNAGAVGINDLVRVVPGLFTVDSGPAERGNNNNLTLRGLRVSPPSGQFPDFPNSTVSPVSTYFGETPVFFPLMLQDLDRVEVLRGPQGTLYGSGSQAGTIRFIPNRPAFGAPTAQLDASGGLTRNSHGDPNAAVDGIINLPLGDKIALRAGAAYERLGGFIDAVGRYIPSIASNPDSPPRPRVPSDPSSGYAVRTEDSTNSSEQWQTHIAALWRPTLQLDIQIDYLHHGVSVDDAQMSNPTFAGGGVDFTQGSIYTTPNSANIVPAGGAYRNTLPSAQPYSADFDLISGVGTIDLGRAKVTSSSSYYDNRTDGHTDFTGGFAIPTSPTTYFNDASFWNFYPRLVAASDTHAEDRAFTQEVRVASSWDKPVDYVVGGYFNDQGVHSNMVVHMPGINAWYRFTGQRVLNPQLPDVNFLSNQANRFSDKAVFGELTWHITPRWQVTGGTRFFWQDYTANAYQLTAIFSPQSTGGVTGSSDNNFSNHVKKLNTSFKFARNNLLYVTYSEGFRRGGSNALSTTGPFASLPSLNRFEPDFARNYEIGIKGLPSPRLRYDLSIYMINLDDFQYQGSTPSGFTAVFNGRTARSSGIELESAAELTERLSATFAYDYMNARLTAPTQIYDLPTGALLHTPPFPPVVALSLADGARLPAVPRNSVIASLDYHLPLSDFGTAAWIVKLHVDESYKTSCPAFIDPASTFYWTIPSSLITSARITLDSGKRWSFDVFGTNLTSDPAYSGSFEWQKYPYYGSMRFVTRPRTLGAGLHYQL